MTEPSTDTDPSRPKPAVDVSLRRHSWEAYSVVVATIVGLLSLAVSAYTAYTLHTQTRAQVFPYLQIITLGEQHRIGVYNKGVGPAFVKRVAIAVDDKPITTWRQFFAAAGTDIKGKWAYSNVNHVPIAANETLPALIFDDAADFDVFQSIDPKRYRVDLCYCSVLDECWSFRSSADSLSEPKSVSSCPVDPKTDFTQ